MLILKKINNKVGGGKEKMFSFVFFFVSSSQEPIESDKEQEICVRHECMTINT